MVALRKDELENPALVDPIYAAAHAPRKIVMFEQRYTADGELTTNRREDEIKPDPAHLRLDIRLHDPEQKPE